MAFTPRSRTPSRSTTPALKPSPSRLVVPSAVRSSNSFSNLRFGSQNSSRLNLASTLPIAIPSPHPQGLVSESLASSLSNTEANEGILIQDVEVEVDTIDGEGGSAVGQLDNMAGDENSKKSLRDKLRETLSRRQPSADTVSSPAQSRWRQAGLTEISYDVAARYPPREYYVLTDAGKPVFTSRPDIEDSGDIASTVGIMQALISVFLSDNDKLRCINAGRTRITFLLRPPLYYVCVSSWGEPESVTRSHLDYLHLQILSIVTAAQLRRIFERRTNFDLRRLLDGTETFLTSLLRRLEFDLALSISSLHCLKLDAGLRKRAADALVPPSKIKDVLYVMLIARGRVITLIRPRKHSIHPADIHILLNTVQSPSILNSLSTASCIPVCLPKFNPAGFVYCYISFLGKDDDGNESENRETRKGLEEQGRTGIQVHDEPPNSVVHESKPGMTLVCICGGGEIETIRGWCDSVSQRLESEGVLNAITTAIRSGATEYLVSELGIPGLRHFVYKSRAHVQVTFPVFEDPYDDINERRRVITLYQIMHDAIHAKSGQEGPLKLQYIRTDKESVMGWITQPFELYVALSPRLPKSAVVGAANTVARWVKKEEERLFLKDAPIF